MKTGHKPTNNHQPNDTMTHAPAAAANYAAAARHPNKRPLPEAAVTPKPAGPAAHVSATRYAPP